MVLFLVAFTPLVIIGVRAYLTARSAILDEVYRQMEAVAGYKRAQVDLWLGERLADLTGALHASLILKNDGKEAAFSAIGSSEFESVALIFDGQIHLSPGSSREDSIWAFGLSTIMAGDRLTHEEPLVYFGPTQFDPEFGTWITLMKAFPAGNDFYIAAGRLKVSSALDYLLRDSTGLGQTGQSYLIDHSHVMLTGSRFHDHPAAGTHKMYSPAIDSGLAGKSGSGVYIGWQNQRSLGAWSAVEGTRWALIAEMKETEALRPIRSLQKEWLLIAILTLIASLIASAMLSRSLTRPILDLASVSSKVSEGDLNQRSNIRRKDELGLLGKSFDKMIESLQISRDALKKSYDDLFAKEASLRQAEKLAAVGELVASVVHELRNPLSAIKMNLKLLARNTAPNSPASQQLSIAGEQAARLELMLNRLLEYSKPMILQVSNFPLRGLIEEVAESLREETATKGIEIHPSVDPDIRLIEADRDLIESVLSNLIQNSLQAMGSTRSGRIDLVVIPEPGNPNELCIQIADNGPGISEANLIRIFEPFFTTKHEGTGLGLPNVKKVIDLHRGMISVQSWEGKGTKVTITLPLRNSDA